MRKELNGGNRKASVRLCAPRPVGQRKATARARQPCSNMVMVAIEVGLLVDQAASARRDGFSRRETICGYCQRGESRVPDWRSSLRFVASGAVGEKRGSC